MGHALRRMKEGPTSYLVGGEGPPLLLLHGIPGSALSWAKAGTALAERFEVLVPDMLGFGASDPPSAGWYLDEQAAAVAAFLDRRGVTELFLGGHDIGAPLAVTLMRRYPALTIRGLVVAAANLFCNVKITPALKITMTPYLNEVIIRMMIGNRLAHRVLWRTAVVHREAYPWAEYRRHLTPGGAKYTRLMYQRTMLEFQSTYAPIEAYLPQIQAPTLLVWGAGDPILRASLGRKTQRTIEGSVLEVYEQTGHYVPEERPGRLAGDIAALFCP